MDYVKGLASKLQKSDMDIYQAYSMIDDVIENVQNLRDNIDTELQHWYDDVKLLVDDVGGREEMPRITRVQRHKANVEAETPVILRKGNSNPMYGQSYPTA